MWKRISDFPKYRVNHLGEVKSFHRHPPRLLRPISRDDGITSVVLCENGRRKSMALHRLVAIAFLGNHPKHEVNHLNGNRLDNRLCNLEWATRKQNAHHASKMGLMVHGEQQHCAKLTEKDIKEIIRLVRGGLKRKAIAEIFGVHKQRIQDIVRGLDWRHITRGRIQLPIITCPFCHYQWHPSFKNELSLIRDCQKCGRLIKPISFASPQLKYL